MSRNKNGIQVSTEQLRKYGWPRAAVKDDDAAVSFLSLETDENYLLIESNISEIYPHSRGN